MIRLAVALILVVLFGAPIVGLHSMPWSAFWFGQQGGTPISVDSPIVFSTPAATLSTPAPSLTGTIEQLIGAARSWLGVPYEWGGCTRHGIDCSCFMRNTFRVIGIELPRVTVDQIRFATPVLDPRPGDLVFFDGTCSNCGANPTHVGLVIGAGQMIDAGDPVKIEPIYGGHNARYGRVLR